MLGSPHKERSAGHPNQAAPEQQAGGDQQVARTSAEVIADSFMGVYYGLRHANPPAENTAAQLQAMYAKDAELTIKNGASESSTFTGSEAIIKQFASMRFDKCKITVEHNADAQISVQNSVLIVLQGTLEHEGAPVRGFSQAFVLAQDTNGRYFIRNDLLRYTDLPAAQPVAVPVQPEPVPEPVPEPTPVAAAPVVEAKPEPVVAKPTPEPAAKPAAAAPEAQKPKAKPVKKEKSSKKKPAKKDAQKAAKKAEKPKAEAAPKALNWAACVGTRVVEKPVVEAAPVEAPKPAAAAAPAEAKKPARANGNDTDGGERRRKQQQMAQYETPEEIEKALFVSSLPEDMGEAEIVQEATKIFEAYGTVSKVIVPNASKHYCFVHYDSVDAKNNALSACAANPVSLRNQELGVQIRKPVRVRDPNDSRRGRGGRGFRGDRGGRQNKDGVDRPRRGGRSGRGRGGAGSRAPRTSTPPVKQ